MNATSPPPLAALGDPRARFVWWLALAGLACMYLPVYWAAARGIWKSDDQAHGAIVLAVVLWLFWSLKEDIATSEVQGSPVLGWTIFLSGLVAYVIGRTVGISVLEFGSQSLVVAGLLVLTRGPQALHVAWFPIFYLLFMVPLPGIFVDAVTGPLKGWISSIVVNVLYAAGYPIARSGVTIMIGPYQMLVADACSGLHSMFSLSALGMLFMYIMARRSVIHNAFMLASMLPISFAANILRVMILVLVTYHLGDETGQGFLHGLAGMVLMLVALASFFTLDILLAAAFCKGSKISAAR